MSIGSAPVPASPAEIAERYNSSIVVRRWGATWVDFLVFIGLLVACLALPESAIVHGVLGVSVIALVYYPLFEHAFGRTPGKFVCRVRVVDAAGGRPSLGQTVIRTLLRLLEVNPVLLGGVPAGIFVLSSRHKQRLGDMAAGTFVLREEDAVYLDRLRIYGAAPSPVPPPLPPPLPPAPTEATSWFVPTNRSGWAIAAGYLGLFSVLMAPAPFALAAGILGLREIRRRPGLGGKGRAIFGIIMGGLFTALLVLVVGSRFFGGS